MCGIAAIFEYGADKHRAISHVMRVDQMCERMVCRGPDGGGKWRSADGRVVLGHRRLSIIDTSERGAQPMTVDQTTRVVSFNGEIYNYRALRADLEGKGHRFQSESDTEVLLRMYREYGTSMLSRLRGMFALALWDEERHAMLLARDPFGIKPLYYADDGNTVVAASEVKAVLAAGGIDAAPDPAGHVGYFLWGHVPEPFTLYAGIHALPAGTYLWIDSRGPQPPCAFASVLDDLRDAEAAMRETEPRAPVVLEQQLREALLDTVRHHLVADVDVGVFLSAGVDSTTLLALASELGSRMRTVTLGFEEFRGTSHDETPVAEAVARHYGADHRTIWISRRDFVSSIDHLLDRMDQPTQDGVNSFFVARAAAEAGLKVALSGLGGDELLGGYASFRQIPQLVRAVRAVPGARRVGRGLRRRTAMWLGRVSSPKYAGLLEYGGDYAGAYLLRRSLFMPWELESLFDREFLASGWTALETLERLTGTIAGLEDPGTRVSALESTWYMRNQLLRDVDWASMTHSVEVRVPFVDQRVWRAVVPMRIRGVASKRTMAATPSRPLPRSVVERAKTGFGVPTKQWLAEDLLSRNAGSSTRLAHGARAWAKYVYDRVAPIAIGASAGDAAPQSRMARHVANV